MSKEAIGSQEIIPRASARVRKKVTHPSSNTVLEGNGLELWLIMASRLPVIN